MGNLTGGVRRLGLGTCPTENSLQGHKMHRNPVFKLYLGFLKTTDRSAVEDPESAPQRRQQTSKKSGEIDRCYRVLLVLSLFALAVLFCGFCYYAICYYAMESALADVGPCAEGGISVTDGDIRRDVRKRGTNERLWWCRFRVETRAEATTHWTFIRPAFQDWEEEDEREGISEVDAECKAEVAHLCWNSEMKSRISIAIDRTVKFILFVTALYLFLVLVQVCLPELGRCGKICRIYCVLPSQNCFTSHTKHM